MNISGMSSFATMPPPQTSGSSTAKSQIDDLVDAIKSGDLESVEDSYAALSSATSAGAHGTLDPVGQFLSSVGSSLENGDLSGLQSAADTFSSYTPPSDTAVPPPPPAPESSDAAGDSLASLISALDDGDSDSAQSAYDSLVNELSANESDTDDGDNPLKAALSQIGDALDSGDTELAQSYLQDMLQNMAPGSIISASV